jgi:hypothetical protein
MLHITRPSLAGVALAHPTQATLIAQQGGEPSLRSKRYDAAEQLQCVSHTEHCISLIRCLSIPCLRHASRKVAMCLHLSSYTGVWVLLELLVWGNEPFLCNLATHLMRHCYLLRSLSLLNYLLELWPTMDESMIAFVSLDTSAYV